MKVIITAAIVLTFTMISCKKEASTDTSKNADSGSANNNSMPTNNSSAMTTDSLNTAAQNASMQKTSSVDSLKNSEGNSSGTTTR